MKNTGKDFVYVTTGHRLRMDQLSEHEYFGEDYVAGKMQPALFRNRAGANRVVWTWDSWDSFDVKPGTEYVFRHARTGHLEMLQLLGAIDADTLERLLLFAPGKVIQWTLK